MSDTFDSGPMLVLFERLVEEPDEEDRIEAAKDTLNDRMPETFAVDDVNVAAGEVYATFEMTQTERSANCEYESVAEDIEMQAEEILNGMGVLNVDLVRRAFCDHPSEKQEVEDLAEGTEHRSRDVARCTLCSGITERRYEA